MKISIITIIVALFCFGCTGKHCITIGGTYQDENGKIVTGDIEYCFDQKESKESGATILKNPKNTIIGIDEKEIDKAISKKMQTQTKDLEQKSIKEKIQILLNK